MLQANGILPRGAEPLRDVDFGYPLRVDPHPMGYDVRWATSTDLLELLRSFRGESEVVDSAKLAPEHALALPRLDPKDLSEDAGAQPEAWTSMA